jgi:thiamine biosynthesis protein ThiS
MSLEMLDTSIEILINGESRVVPEGLSVESLLHFLKIDPSRVAVEHNREIVRKTAWANTPVNPKDQFEIVWFVGGG